MKTGNDYAGEWADQAYDNVQAVDLRLLGKVIGRAMADARR